MNKKVMFYCQHILGMGHLIRSTEIVRGLVGSGFDVCFLNGGEIVEGFQLPPSIEVVNLPPIKSDAEFRQIHATDGALNLDEVKEPRRQRILAEYARFQPDALIIELFPFGRRKFAFELIPLLEQIKADGRRTKVVCSLRDILVSKRDQTRFDDQVCDAMNRYFDLLLVHADPQFQRLEETFPRLPEIECPIRYTGFVVQKQAMDQSPRQQMNRETNILVSIGGGRVGYELLECAVEASALLADRLPHRMRIFTGPYLPEEQFNKLREQAANSSLINVERFTSNFLSHLEHADLSVSMAGYNTCMNLLTTGTRALVYPFTGNNNEEQTIRAEKLEKLGAVAVIRDHQLEPRLLAENIFQHCVRQHCRRTQAATVRPSLDLNGAEKTAATITEFLNQGAVSAAGAGR